VPDLQLQFAISTQVAGQFPMGGRGSPATGGNGPSPASGSTASLSLGSSAAWLGASSSRLWLIGPTVGATIAPPDPEDLQSRVWPDQDETTRAAIGDVIATRVASSSEDRTDETVLSYTETPARFASLHVVIQCELVRVRPDLDRQDLVLPLEADPRLNEVGCENATLSEVFVVIL
jgi:hypothetical protein